jgi:hypothetical protein
MYVSIYIIYLPIYLSKLWVEEKNQYLVYNLSDALLRFEIANDNCCDLSEEASKHTHSAYITFEQEFGYLKCRETYLDHGFLTRCIQKKALKWKADKTCGQTCGGGTVYVSPASAPEEIIFENEAVPAYSQVLRTIVTTIITIVLLLLSYVAIYVAMKYSKGIYIYIYHLTIYLTIYLSYHRVLYSV